MINDQLLANISTALSQIEGPYKWYIIAAGLFILTGIIIKVIFRTLKWFVLLLLFAALILGIFWFLQKLSG